MTALRVSELMTVQAFMSWEPDDRPDHRWQLVDGMPVCMGFNSFDHGCISAEAAFLLISQLRTSKPAYGVAIVPGVIPGSNPTTNVRVPDLGVTAAPPAGAHFMRAPLLLIEILSPPNAAINRANVAAYTTNPSVKEILLLDSTTIAAELLRRDDTGAWPADPLLLDRQDTVALTSAGFEAPLAAFYRTTSLKP
jgi:Uma2 family endonuclease